MNRVPSGVAFILLVITTLVVLFLLAPSAGSFRADIVETLTGETPEAKVAAYLRAIARSDADAALASWELPDWELAGGRSARLAERRRQMTTDLIASAIKPDFRVVGIEWWRTCCEPGVTSVPRSAGGARMEIELFRINGERPIYRFDVFALGGAYYGAAADYPPRKWALRDVYHSTQEPLFWPLTNDAAILFRDPR